MRFLRTTRPTKGHKIGDLLHMLQSITINASSADGNGRSSKIDLRAAACSPLVESWEAETSVKAFLRRSRIGLKATAIVHGDFRKLPETITTLARISRRAVCIGMNRTKASFGKKIKTMDASVKSRHAITKRRAKDYQTAYALASSFPGYHDGR